MTSSLYVLLIIDRVAYDSIAYWFDMAVIISMQHATCIEIGDTHCNTR